MSIQDMCLVDVPPPPHSMHGQPRGCNSGMTGKSVAIVRARHLLQWQWSTYADVVWLPLLLWIPNRGPGGGGGGKTFSPGLEQTQALNQV
jgi:hypothetical protein